MNFLTATDHEATFAIAKQTDIYSPNRMLKDYRFQPIYSSTDPDNFKREGGSTQKGGPE